jgi:Amt family ammonium transporter
LHNLLVVIDDLPRVCRHTIEKTNSMNITAPEQLHIGFVLGCAAIVFLMQAGFCLLESGMVRSKNSINVAVKNILDCSLAMLLFVFVGFTIMFGVSYQGLFGIPFSLDFANDPKLLTFMLFQLVFCSAAATIVSGAVAERVRLSIYLAIVLVVSGVVYPVFGHWAWGGALPGTELGWLAKMGFIDWAGGSVVHIVGGFAALAAAQTVGRRHGLTRNKLTGGYSLTLAILGTFLLWFGWWGFNGGSGLAPNQSLPGVLLCTNLGAVGGGLMAALYSRLLHKKIEVIPLAIGLLAGLVSITPSCHVISPIYALAAGAIGALVALSADVLLQKLKIDDAVGAFQVHGAAGLWGVIALAIFAPDSALAAGSRLAQLQIQCLGAVVAAVFSYITVLMALKLLACFTPLRVTEEEERIGLNVVEHGATNEFTDLLVQLHNHSSSGDFSTEISCDTHSEAGQIAKEYNQVIARVRSEMTDHEKTNRELVSEQLQMKSVLDHVGVGIYQLNIQGELVTANPTLLNMLNYQSSDEITTAQSKQTDILLPWHESDSEHANLIQQRFQAGEDTQEFETQITNANGQLIWVLESLVPVRDESKSLIGWLGTVHDISEQKRATLAEIEIAKAKSEAKGEFLASMSHEIRTPLNGVIGMLDLLDASTLPTREKNFVSIAKTSAGSLLSLINDILDFSKIEAGHMELEEIEYDVRELIEQTAEQFAYHAHVKQLEMNCQIDDDLPHILVGDPERLRQVLVNLIGNAIKFTEQGEVNLNVSRRGDVMRIGIQDTGIGMDEKTRKKLFQSFTQADASTTRKYGGTGLGLAITAQLIDLMNGTIHADSKPGEGSEFWFEVEMLISQEQTPTIQETQKLLERLPNTRVLIIDDNSTNCEILANQFNNWGLNVSVCKEPTSVVDRMLVAARIGKPFDLVILDFCMPVMNGRDVAVAMRKEAVLARTPIIILSSNYELLSQKEMETVGIHAAITKPARQSRLLDTVMDALFKGSISEQTPKENGTIQKDINVHSEPPTRFENVNREFKQQENASVYNTQIQTQLDDEIDVFENHETPTYFRELVEPVVGSEPLDSQTSFPEQTHSQVLIVEDNHVNRIVAQKMLSELGIQSDFAVNGSEGVEKARQGDYQLILMDGHMPIMDGLTATRQIRQWETQQSSERTPIVALTANVVRGIRQECLDAGMDDYLCKPITLISIRRVVDKYLADCNRGPATKPTKVYPAQENKLDRDQNTSHESATSNYAPSNSLSHQSSASQPPATQQSPIGVQRRDSAPTVQERTRSLTAESEFGSTRSESMDDNLISMEDLKRHCCGDADFAMQILEIMKSSLPNQIREIEKASSISDFQQVAGIAHQLKGAAGDSCMVAVFESAGKLEHHAKNNEQAQVLETFEQLRFRVEATVEKIGRLLTS